MVADEIPEPGSDDWNAALVKARRARRFDQEVVSGKPVPTKLWSATELNGTAQPKFLARNRIPSGAITILIGEEGIGKSLLWVYLVAALTTGKPLDEFGIPPRDPAFVHLAITEDEWESVVRPRLEVAGADLDYVRVMAAEKDGSGSPVFPDDMHLITDADPAPAMVVIDAWLDTVPGMFNVKDPQQGRAALHPWRETANVTGAAVMLLTHTNRLGSSNIRDRYGITASLRQKARMTLFCLAGEDDGHLIVGPDKSNGASGRTQASIFRIIPVQHFEPTPDHDGTVPKLEFVAQSDRTIRQHLADALAAEKTATRPVSDAEQWLRDLLADGPRLANDVYAAGKASEFDLSKDQLKRAKARCGAKAFKKTNDDRWWWKLKDEDQKPSQQTKFKLIPGGEGDG